MTRRPAKGRTYAFRRATASSNRCKPWAEHHAGEGPHPISRPHTQPDRSRRKTCDRVRGGNPAAWAEQAAEGKRAVRCTGGHSRARLRRQPLESLNLMRTKRLSSSRIMSPWFHEPHEGGAHTKFPVSTSCKLCWPAAHMGQGVFELHDLKPRSETNSAQSPRMAQSAPWAANGLPAFACRTSSTGCPRWSVLGNMPTSDGWGCPDVSES